MTTADGFRAEAERCARLARQTVAKDVAEQLVKMAAEYRRRADEFDRQTNGATGE
jgi:hypothetical protein